MAKTKVQCPNCGGYKISRKSWSYYCNICGHAYQTQTQATNEYKAKRQWRFLWSLLFFLAGGALVVGAVARQIFTDDKSSSVEVQNTIIMLCVGAPLLLVALALFVAARAVKHRIVSPSTERISADRDLIHKKYEQDQTALAYQTHQYLTGDDNSLL